MLRTEQLIFAEIYFEHHGQTHIRWCVAKDRSFIPQNQDEWNYWESDYGILTLLVRFLAYGEIKDLNPVGLEDGIEEVRRGNSSLCILYYR